MFSALFKNIDKSKFLAQYWQKAPCIFRHAFEVAESEITADELAGLSLEQDIESRLIIQCDNNWLLEHGPFDEGRYSKLPTENWTLLVQSVDHHVPAIHSLLDEFDFIPRWRLDDIMVSYATNNGGVGPHTDNYDVFLIQVDGKRRWRVGAKDSIHVPNLDVDGLSLVNEFDPDIDIELEPGDMLYIPPNTAHWGVSLGESMGYSIGFRSPQTHQLLGILADDLSSNISKNQFFTDSYRSNADHSNKIEPELIAWAQKELKELANQPDKITTLLARHLSLSKLDIGHAKLPDKKQIVNCDSSIKIESCFCANWHVNNDQVVLYIEGDCFQFPLALIESVKNLANYEAVANKLFRKTVEPFDFLEVLTSLITKGYVKQFNLREPNNGISN